MKAAIVLFCCDIRNQDIELPNLIQSAIMIHYRVHLIFFYIGITKVYLEISLIK